ncbi:hypothetical protein EDD15DRAFT_2489749 [Pisolithus albus]|nr:hypothetical protein EDD15DRAFT_2489749 [Pisolithus albus]
MFVATKSTAQHNHAAEAGDYPVLCWARPEAPSRVLPGRAEPSRGERPHSSTEGGITSSQLCLTRLIQYSREVAPQIGLVDMEINTPSGNHINLNYLGVAPRHMTLPAMTVCFSVARVEAGQRLDITGQLPCVHAPVLEEHVKESREKRAELRRAMSIRALPGCAGAMIKGGIAMEEEKLKNDSAEDVRRQLEQQHVAESEEKAVQGIKRAADKLLSHTGEAIEAKLAPVLSVAEHTTESVVSDGAAGVEDLQDERAVHEYLALAADSHERSLPLSINTKHNLLGILPNGNEQREGAEGDRTVGERKTCDYKGSTIPNHASPVHSIRDKDKYRSTLRLVGCKCGLDDEQLASATIQGYQILHWYDDTYHTTSDSEI